MSRYKVVDDMSWVENLRHCVSLDGVTEQFLFGLFQFFNATFYPIYIFNNELNS